MGGGGTDREEKQMVNCAYYSQGQKLSKGERVRNLIHLIINLLVHEYGREQTLKLKMSTTFELNLLKDSLASVGRERLGQVVRPDFS